MADAVLEELVEDAILVASYGRRCGRFNDTSLFAAIQKSRSKGELSWGDPEVLDLQSAMNSAIRLIYPVTLIDLKEGWSPFRENDSRTVRIAGRKKLGFIFSAVALMFLCIYYTSWYKAANDFALELSNEKPEQQDVLIDDILIRLLQFKDGEAEREFDDPKGLSRIAMREKIERARWLDNLMLSHNQKFGEFFVNYNIVRPYYYTLLSLLHPAPSYAAGASDASKPKPRSASEVVAAGMVPFDSGNGLGQGSTKCVNYAERQRPTASSDRIAPASVLPLGQRQMLKLNTYVSEDDLLRIQLRCMIGLAAQSERPTDMTSRENWLKLRISDLNLWGLPAMYGALGAVMFYMRSFLSPFLRDPPFHRILLRVSLGMFAGIAIAWFWSPSMSRGIAGDELTLGVLAIAFLVGFSIDVFFTLLDRLVTLTTQSIGRLGTASDGRG